MELIGQKITQHIIQITKDLYQQDIDNKSVLLQQTNAGFEGDLTVVVFALTKISRKTPEITAQEIGEQLQNRLPEIIRFNFVKGFLNLVLTDKYWIDFLAYAEQQKHFAFAQAHSGKSILLEFSSPNTNKPLHLGHVRNNLLGYSLALVLEANGHKVIKANLINDRGIHICKTMLAWKRWSNHESPNDIDAKGDHFVGNYYVLFEKNLKAEMAELMAKGMNEDEARKNSTLMQQAQEMLRLWEDKDLETIQLWRTMNKWVYEGFEQTYNQMGISFDKVYYESETYSLGKQLVQDGLKKGTFISKEDGSVWIDLTADGLDEKILLRSDGTSVYITQDIGTAHLRQKEYNPNQFIYVVGNEQDYHFNVLKLVLKKSGYEWSDNIFHLSYGMVELPEGKMKSREGKVVDADDLMEEMVSTAKEITRELGKTEGMSYNEANELYNMIGMGALKYFILKVDPKKNITFNPAESIDFNGNTGPFIQYTYARIQSIIRKASENQITAKTDDTITLNESERSIINLAHQYPEIIQQAGNQYSPAIIANYMYEVAKEYNQFYHNCPILKEENVGHRDFRIITSQLVGKILKSGMGLLGIEMPNRM